MEFPDRFALKLVKRGESEDDKAFWSCRRLPLVLPDPTCRQGKGDSKLNQHRARFCPETTFCMAQTDIVPD